MFGIPVVYALGDTLPEAWEKALLSIYHHGEEMPTEYDKEEDPLSRDATAVVTVFDPLAEPRIHKNIPCGFRELEVYRQEVVNGIHDHWIDPDQGKWAYTYHERLFSYPFSPKPVDQISFVANTLINNWFSRRAQAITWDPITDPYSKDPPCLQRIWCRVTPDYEGGQLCLNMNTHWRSRDLYKAWFMNAYAMISLQKMIADRLSQEWLEKVELGRYVDISDSLHIYGSYMDEVSEEVKKIEAAPDSWPDRSWETSFEVFQQETRETRRNLEQDPDYMKAKE